MGWCISDSESIEVIKAFLGSMKARSPNTIVSVIMTDDGKSYCINLYTHFKQPTVYMICTDNTGWSATKAVFGEIKHLLCHWHVDRFVWQMFTCIV